MFFLSFFVVFPPDRPVILGCVGRPISGVIGADGHPDLGIREEMADLAFFLDAQMLADGFFVGQSTVFHFQVGTFALDHREGDAVDEADDVGTAGLVGTLALDDEFFADVVDVVFRMRPIDIVQGVVAGVAVDGLRQGDTQGQGFVDTLVGAGQAIVQTDAGQEADSFGDGVLAESAGLPFVFEAIVVPQPTF